MCIYNWISLKTNGYRLTLNFFSHDPLETMIFQETMSKEDCQDLMAETARNPGHKPNSVDFFCLYLSFGASRSEAMTYASTLSRRNEGDIDGF